jgi:hypothetical protein
MSITEDVTTTNGPLGHPEFGGSSASVSYELASLSLAEVWRAIWHSRFPRARFPILQGLLTVAYCAFLTGLGVPSVMFAYLGFRDSAPTSREMLFCTISGAVPPALLILRTAASLWPTARALRASGRRRITLNPEGVVILLPGYSSFMGWTP